MQSEKTPLLSKNVQTQSTTIRSEKKAKLVKRIAESIVEYLNMVLSTLLAGPKYLISGLYDESGQFTAWRSSNDTARRKADDKQEKDQDVSMSSSDAYSTGRSWQRDSVSSTLSSIADEDELSRDMDSQEGQSGEAQTNTGLSDGRSASSSDSKQKDGVTSAGSSEEVTPRRSTRIKIANPDGGRQRKTRRGPPEPLKSKSGEPLPTLDSVKSPTSPKESIARITRYPRAPAPPRPLVPQRRPSYTRQTGPLFNPANKTLVLDLDETLIHSASKGGRMGTGQMVEVRLKTSVAANGVALGPQVPILYWVAKRPYCDEFLRKVSKWYNLIIFTASVQEYADPVIDILEQERKFFSGRYYRQHCTYRGGAYVKDLSQVEPDLSKVMILDNSPISYIFHEDNAIPITGWTNDPTDGDLLHLLPVLEALQHTTDVRSLLALRLGESSGLS